MIRKYCSRRSRRGKVRPHRPRVPAPQGARIFACLKLNCGDMVHPLTRREDNLLMNYNVKLLREWVDETESKVEGNVRIEGNKIAIPWRWYDRKYTSESTSNDGVHHEGTWKVINMAVEDHGRL